MIGPEQEARRAALIRIRKRLRMTQLDVAQAAGVNRATLSLWEGGYSDLPDEALDRITGFLLAEVKELRDPELVATLARNSIPQEATK